MHPLTHLRLRRVLDGCFSKAFPSPSTQVDNSGLLQLIQYWFHFICILPYSILSSHFFQKWSLCHGPSEIQACTLGHSLSILCLFISLKQANIPPLPNPQLFYGWKLSLDHIIFTSLYLNISSRAGIRELSLLKNAELFFICHRRMKSYRFLEC